MAKKILVVDDELKIVQLVRAYLQQAGFSVLTASTGKDALTLWKVEQPALIVLDLMLPDMDGFDVAREIRKKSNTPIIMLTARAEDADRIAGLEIGADDYVVKPFNPRELVARVRAVLRRVEDSTKPNVIEAGDLVINLDSYEAYLKGKLLDLTPTEFKLLATLAEQPGRVFTRLQLTEALLGTTYATLDRTIDTHIKNLRRKLEPNSQNPTYILTVHGVGYKFRNSSP
uniref:Two-component system, OmpR family, alkaline phosphatase synthesis response regulator PhoP n=1 Tax=Acetithermum autotrophicum TaxID=1446466 RepID=H5SQV1_ACEAU|nr:two-component system, OmpR family, alkaline phosphatase synthesis response regulator PhoP [Candidatus Acetothermum autotrophicum]